MKVLDTFRLDGKVALVTGGAGLYGRQIVEALAEAGAKTFMASRNLDALEAQARRFRDAGLDVTAFEYDQGDFASIDRLFEQIVALAGTADVLVNNSVARLVPGWSAPVETIEQSMRINATGLFYITRRFGNHMADLGRGSIIMVGSIHGMIGPNYTLYEGTDMGRWPPDYPFQKSGMINFTRYVAGELGDRGVRCNCISPGGFFDHQPEPFVQSYNKHTFLGRMANESDLKGVVVLLASDASAYITATNIPVDGGYVAM